MITAQKPRRFPGIILVVIAGLALIGVLAWRLLPSFGTQQAPDISASFHPTPEGAPVEVAAPLAVDVNLDLRDTSGSGPRISPSVDLQLRDAQGQPAIFGDGPANPVIMHVGGTFTSWTADMS